VKTKAGLKGRQSVGIGLGLRRWAYFQVFIRRQLVFNIFPFPVSKAKFIGDFYNNRRSAAISCQRFACSFGSLM
jgi:hypothetical protein